MLNRIAETAGCLSAKILNGREFLFAGVDRFDIWLHGIENIPHATPCVIASTHYRTDEQGTPYDAMILRTVYEQIAARPLYAIARIDPPGNTRNLELQTAFRKGLMSNIPWVIPIFTTENIASHREMLEKSQMVATEGSSILIFPWGEMCREFDPEKEVKPGAAFLAEKLGLPLVPVFINGPKTARKGEISYVEFGKPIIVERGRENRAAATEYIREEWIRMNGNFESEVLADV